jgi:hypothetical protein
MRNSGEVEQTISQDADQSAFQANLAAGNVLTIDLAGKHNHANLNKASFVLTSDIDQTNALLQAVGQDAENDAFGFVFNKHGHVIGRIDVSQSIEQSAAQDAAQANLAAGNVLTIDLSGEHNHANLNKASFVLTSDIDQTNLLLQAVGQDASNDVNARATATARPRPREITQSSARMSRRRRARSTAALGNLLVIDLDGEHNHST